MKERQTDRQTIKIREVKTFIIIIENLEAVKANRNDRKLTICVSVVNYMYMCVEKYNYNAKFVMKLINILYTHFKFFRWLP